MMMWSNPGDLHIGSVACQQLCGCAELRQMRMKADTDKKEAALAVSSMQTIEAAAKKAYEKDLAAQQASARANGDWVSLDLA